MNQACAWTPQSALEQLGQAGAEVFVTLLSHESVVVEYYRPRGRDHQTPHSLDEVYVIISGEGTFVREGERRPVTAGELIFVPAGQHHRFEQFSDDFATWVIFFGPEGGAAAAG